MIADQADSSYRPAVDLGAPRRSVLVYYGLGGVGKTALSKRLERTLLEGTRTGIRSERRVAVRVDFGEAGELDIEGILLRLRAGLVRVSRRWPAFDLAFSLAWERSHPGESLPAFIRQNSILRHHGHRTDLAEQIQNTLVEILGEIGMAWAPSRILLRAASITHDQLSRSRTYRRMIRECPFFEPIVTAEPPSEALPFMSSLIAWQLAEEHREDPSLVTVFLDTFEALDRSDRDFERQVQRLVFCLPNVLFVITGRNRLDWADTTVPNELDYVGPARWPLMRWDNVTDEPRQHLVGALSPADCEEYLLNVLRKEDGSPALPSELRARIVRGSDGLPLYLDLSVTHFLELTAAGMPVGLAEFGGPLSAIVVRIMRNLDREQRDIVRGVALLDSFDRDLARAASGGSDAVIGRLINSSLVSATVGLPWPYALHAQLRRTIQESDHELRDAWSEREWSMAARRVVDHLGAVCEAARTGRNRSAVAAALSQAVRLALRFDYLPTWVLGAAQFLADVGPWRALSTRYDGDIAQSTEAAALAHGLTGILQRRSGSLEDSVRSFDTALALPTLRQPARDLLVLHRTHSIRNSGQYDAAEREYHRIVANNGPHADRARLQVADISLLKGRFHRALSQLEGLPEHPDLLGESLRIRGHVYRANCRFADAELMYRRVQAIGLESASAPLEGKALTNLAETLCWEEPERAELLADEAIDFNLALGNQLEVLKAYAAKGVASRTEAGDRAIEDALTLAGRSKYRAGALFALTARIFRQLVYAGTEPDIRATALEISAITTELNVYQFWREIVGWWVLAARGVRLSSHSDNADWLQPVGETRERWVRTLNGRIEGQLQ